MSTSDTQVGEKTSKKDIILRFLMFGMTMVLAILVLTAMYQQKYGEISDEKYVDVANSIQQFPKLQEKVVQFMVDDKIQQWEYQELMGEYHASVKKSFRERMWPN